MKKCSGCGNINPDENNFCSKCGKNLDDLKGDNDISKEKESEHDIESGKGEEHIDDKTISVNEPGTNDGDNKIETKKHKTRTWLISALCILVITILCVFGFIMLGDNIRTSVDIPKHSFEVVNNVSDGSSDFYLDDSVMLSSVSSISNVGHSTDSGVFSVLNFDNELYIIDGDSCVMISNAVTGSIIAGSGEAVAYYDSNNNLFLYDADKKATELIASNIEDYGISISPDGKTLLYSVDDILYCYNKGKVEEVAEDQVGLAVSDKGKRIYSIGYMLSSDGSYTASLFESSYGKQGQTRIASSVDTTVKMIFNENISQMLFVNMNKELYLLGKNGEAILIYSDVDEILPCKYGSEAIGHGSDGLMYDTNSSSDYIARIVPMNKFVNAVYYSGNDLFYIENDFSSYVISTDTLDYKMSKNGSKIFYLTNSNDLYLTGVSSGSVPELISSQISLFDIANNGKNIYTVSIDGDLSYINTSNLNSKNIEKDVTYIGVSGENVCFIIKDEKLSYSQNGSSPVSLNDNISDYRIGSNYMIFTDGSGNEYHSNGNVNFTQN